MAKPSKALPGARCTRTTQHGWFNQQPATGGTIRTSTGDLRGVSTSPHPSLPRKSHPGWLRPSEAGAAQPHWVGAVLERGCREDPTAGVAGSGALLQPRASGWHSHVLPCQGPARSINDEGGGKLCYESLNKVAFKALFRSKRKHPQNHGGDEEGAALGVLQPQQIPPLSTPEPGSGSITTLQLFGSAPSPPGPKLITRTHGRSRLQENPLAPGVSSTRKPTESQPLAPPPSSACRDGTDGGARAGRSSQTSRPHTPHPPLPPTVPTLCPPRCSSRRAPLPKAAPGSCSAWAGPVPPALGLRNHWFQTRNRIPGDSPRDDAVMEVAPQERRCSP